MNGTVALEYARSRHQDSDYGRMQRQQLVLLALQRQLKPCRILADLPNVLEATKDTLTTTFTVDDIPDLLHLAARLDSRLIEQFAFIPPSYPEYLQNADWTRIQKVVQGAFEHAPEPSPSPSPGASAEPDAGC